ncbi:hypothetical protein CALCODRAFT_491804 [Calocera cornea HHB12733]|uniref:Large ribosomal subunit protein mL59 domain-containing protein n=1 Tax=Calocera cornea HHB12733 TaxID=1353952 RepID=A0A165IR81_9BASI|nr:hypothetical protein CALCODRAFT_491804 [Calocera cornea HHB12733]
MASLFARTPTSRLLTTFLNRTRTRALALLPPTLQSSPPTPLPAPNPFIPTYNPASRCWAPPEYSKRRQKELWKAAVAEGLVGWLPIGEGERVGGGRKAEELAHRGGVVAAPEKGEEGNGVEVEVQGEQTVLEIAPQLRGAKVLAKAAQRLAKQTHVPATNTTPQPVTDPSAPFQWIGIPSPVYSHPTVYGSRPRERWFKGHKREQRQEERKEQMEAALEKMDLHIRKWKNSRRKRMRHSRTRGGGPF